VRFLFHEYLCYQCDARFWPRQRQWTRSKIGSGLLAYIIYQIIELRLSQEAVTQSLNQLFNVNLSQVNRQKSRAALFYKDTYEGILKRIVNGKLMHADETKANIKGKDAFVWVFTNLLGCCVLASVRSMVIAP
jgi:transposase